MNKTSSYSRYWLDEDIFVENDNIKETKEEASLARITRLSSARRAVANFVNILTNRNDILVEYSSGKQSYTDGTRVVISADDNAEHFDSMVGLALHEGSHILLSDFAYLKEIAKTLDQISDERMTYDIRWIGVDVRPTLKGPLLAISTRDSNVTVLQSLLHPVLANLLPSVKIEREAPASSVNTAQYSVVARRFVDDILMIMNIIEDRRIDKFVYQTCGGYRPYYDSLYQRYFITADVEKNLKWNPEWRELTVENYINRLLFSIHPANKRDALPGLGEIIDLMDIRNIHRFTPSNDYKTSWAFTDQPLLWKVANTIYAYILRFSALSKLNDTSKSENVGNISTDSIITNTNALPNLDMGGPTAYNPQPTEDPDKTKTGKDKPTAFNAKRGESSVKKAREVAAGELKKKKVTKQEKTAVDALESAQAKMVDLEGDGIPGGQCMVTRKIGENILEQDWFIFSNKWMSEYSLERSGKHIAAGKRMGQILVHRLQVRNDPVLTKNTRLQHGGLDRRLLAQLGMDITSVFQKSRIDTFKPAMLHLTIDASGSMSGRKWDKVITVATALAYVGSKMQNVDTVVSIRGGNDIPIVAVLFDSRKDKFTSWLKWAPRISPNGSTPEGLCFKATMEMITESTATHDVYFINFSDGEPGFSLHATNVGGKNSSRIGRGAHRRCYYDEYCNYAGDLATKHTRQMVQNMREHGVKILSYFISDSQPHSHGMSREMVIFKKMYGEDAVFVNVENGADVLRTLNKLLTNRV